MYFLSTVLKLHVEGANILVPLKNHSIQTLYLTLPYFLYTITVILSDIFENITIFKKLNN